mmetsp:Transcript_58941/g.155009  ORF Transcript_58941/g.155009 Transcript_58941/m.155009 type:complete len:113 (+) Transcript_58941:512-850(+)
MDYKTRLPRRMLSSWVTQRRPVGAPSMTYGRSAFKALSQFQVNSACWYELAADRSAWRETLRTGLAPGPARLPPAGAAALASHLAQQDRAQLHTGHHGGDRRDAACRAAVAD